VTITWTTTERGDEIADVVFVNLNVDGFEIATLEVTGLPSETGARQRMIEHEVNWLLSGLKQDILTTHLSAEFEITTASEWESTSPPMFATWLIVLLAPESSANAQLGDLDDMFQQNVKRFGEKAARRKYWKQVIMSLVPWLKRLVVTVLVGYLRSKFGL
jgi:hypothetical protein